MLFEPKKVFGIRKCVKIAKSHILLEIYKKNIKKKKY